MSRFMLWRGTPGSPVDFRGSDIEISGGMFDINVGETLERNSARIVRELTEEGARLVREGIKPQKGTGFTRELIEAHQNREGSMFGRVRAKPKQEREPGSLRYPASRRPYITLAVLESGRMGGHREYRVRLRANRGYVRKSWVRGAKTRKPMYAFRSAVKILRRKADTIRADLIAKGLG